MIDTCWYVLATAFSCLFWSFSDHTFLVWPLIHDSFVRWYLSLVWIVFVLCFDHLASFVICYWLWACHCIVTWIFDHTLICFVLHRLLEYCFVCITSCGNLMHPFYELLCCLIITCMLSILAYFLILCLPWSLRIWLHLVQDKSLDIRILSMHANIRVLLSLPNPRL